MFVPVFVFVFVPVFVFVSVFVFVLASIFVALVGTHRPPETQDVVVAVATSSKLSPLSYYQIDKYP